MSGIVRAIGALEFARYAVTSPPSLVAAYLLRAANEDGDIAVRQPARLFQGAVVP
jgi:hypothetical protein